MTMYEYIINVLDTSVFKPAILLSKKLKTLKSFIAQSKILSTKSALVWRFSKNYWKNAGKDAKIPRSLLSILCRTREMSILKWYQS